MEKPACFDPVVVQPNQTFEVVMNLNTSWSSAPRGTKNHIRLKRNNLWAAAFSENSNPWQYDGKWGSAPISLNYREKLVDDINPVTF